MACVYYAVRAESLIQLRLFCVSQMFNVDLMSIFYLLSESEFFHRKFDCCDLLRPFVILNTLMNFYPAFLLHMFYFAYRRRLRWSSGWHAGLWQFTGSNPAEAVGFFGRKNPQHAFLRRGSKRICPMSQVCGM